MSARTSSVPALFHHKAKDCDAVCIRGADGRRRMIYCGKHGTPAAQRRYREVLAQWFANQEVGPTRVASEHREARGCPTVSQLCAEFLLFAQRYYVDPDGKPTSEVESSVYAFKELLRLHRDTPTDRVSIRHLLDVRQALIDQRLTHKHGRRAPNGLSRRTINDRMQRIKRLFRWGVERGLVPGSTWHELSALRGLPKGRGGVHDNAPIEAVPWGLVEATLPHLVPTVRAVVQTQWWSGMRPAEVLAMTRRQLDMSGETWLYRPERVHRRVHAALRRLGRRDRMVIELRTGIRPKGAGHDATISEVATIMRISRERVRQLEQCALARLARRLHTAVAS